MTPQEDRPMDPLTELLAQALEDWQEGDPPEDRDLSDEWYERPSVLMRRVVAAIDPAKADAMRAGLLLGEVEARIGPVRQWIITSGNAVQVDAWIGPNTWHVGHGPTLLAALIELRDRLVTP